MSSGEDTRDEMWGEKTARVTFLWLVACVIAFFGVVLIFILR
jgi:hypothetical protein